MLIKAVDILEETNVSSRQLDYWVRYGIIPTVGTSLPGSGYHRQFEDEVIDRVKLLVAISKSFKHFLSKEMLAKIYNAYEDGHIEIATKDDVGYNIVLSWEK